MLRKTIGVATFLLLLATAGYGQRFGIGGSLGTGFTDKTITQISGDDFKFDGRDFAWKAYASVDWRFLGIEGGYRDFGEIKTSSVDTTLSSRTRGGDLMAKGVFRLAILELYGKAGGFFKRTENSLFKGNEDISAVIDRIEKGTQFIWGVGLGINLGNIGLRAEWEQVQTNPGRLAMISFGINIGFGNYR